jgi:chromosome segregation ATPase
VEAAQLRAELEFRVQRADLAVSETAHVRAEADALRSRAADLSAQLAAHEASLQSLRAQLTTAQQNAERATSELAHVRVERDLLSASESRLSEENAKLAAQHARQERLLQSLQAMQSALEQKEADGLRRALEDKATAQREWLDTKRLLDSERLAHRDAVRLADAAKEELRARVEAADARAQGSREELLKAQAAAEVRRQRTSIWFCI